MNKNKVVNGIVFDTAKANCMWGTEMYISIKELPETLTDTVNKAVAARSNKSMRRLTRLKPCLWLTP